MYGKTYSTSTPRSPESVTTGALCRERPSHSAIWSLMNSAVMGSPVGCDSRGNRRVAYKREKVTIECIIRR